MASPPKDSWHSYGDWTTVRGAWGKVSFRDPEAELLSAEPSMRHERAASAPSFHTPLSPMMHATASGAVYQSAPSLFPPSHSHSLDSWGLPSGRSEAVESGLVAAIPVTDSPPSMRAIHSPPSPLAAAMMQHHGSPRPSTAEARRRGRTPPSPVTSLADQIPPPGFTSASSIASRSPEMSFQSIASVVPDSSFGLDTSFQPHRRHSLYSTSPIGYGNDPYPFDMMPGATSANAGPSAPAPNPPPPQQEDPFARFRPSYRARR